MKTTRNFTALGLIMILLIGNVIEANCQIGKKGIPVGRAVITYEVTVNLPSNFFTCNTFLVQVADERGTPVAHPQELVPGVNKYVFTEPAARVDQKRVASLELYTSNGIHGCMINIITKPEIKKGPFTVGETYIFTLKPFILGQ